MRILGVDYGRAKVGFALGDKQSGVAAPLEVIYVADDQSPADVVEKMVAQEEPELLVVGVPLTVGSFHSSDQLEEVRAFIDDLAERLSIEIHEIDESFTSRESQRLQQEKGAMAKEDALAAMLILQAWIDEQR
jgi:putative Holliday junction resolvase